MELRFEKLTTSRSEHIIILIDSIDISYFMDKSDIHPATPRVQRAPLAPSPRVTAALAGAMLAIGVAAGAAIGPAPAASLAVDPAQLAEHLPLLLAQAGVDGHTSSAGARPPAITRQATPRLRLRRRHAHRAIASEQPSPSTTTPAAEAPAPSSPAPNSTGKAKTSTLPPIANVWLIELSGPSFASALETPSGAPYINEQAAPAGTELSSWSALDAGGFANDAALLATGGPQILDTIQQPPCPEGAAGAPCAAGTPGALGAADEFLKTTVATITATATYRTGGLIVVTFGSIAAGAATGLPSGASSFTATSQSPAGALLISPFVTAGASSSIAFNPASPTQSLEKLLHQ
jgi:hypothetical protein